MSGHGVRSVHVMALGTPVLGQLLSKATYTFLIVYQGFLLRGCAAIPEDGVVQLS